MSATCVADRLTPLLFGQEGVRLINIKFFRGDRDVISEEEFCNQVHAALTQRRLGRAYVTENLDEAVKPALWREQLARI